MDMKDTKIVFAEGCFDNFEGTQEELDELIAEIQRLVDTGEIFERSVPLDLDSLSEEELVNFASAVLDGDKLEELHAQGMPKRTLQ
jgi:hypothetical protein